jgi:acyl carrier protein
MKVALRRIISETACLDVPVETLSDTDNLFAAGLSSIGTVRVMLAIEESLRIEIPETVITFDMFRCIDSLASALAPLVCDERPTHRPYAAAHQKLKNL